MAILGSRADNYIFFLAREEDDAEIEKWLKWIYKVTVDGIYTQLVNIKCLELTLRIRDQRAVNQS